VLGKLRFLLLACVGATLAWGVAPALSLTPYAPRADDFTQPVPAVAALGDEGPSQPGVRAIPAREGDGPVRFLSPVIEAPARFDLVGIAREMRPIEYRARPEGGEWSPWTEASDGNPVYFGGADELQIRSRGVRPEGELHYVNVSGTETLADTVLNRVRETVNTAFISVAGTAIADAHQQVAPAIVTRDQWGATLEDGGCPPRTGPSYGEVKAAVIHHTVSANDYTPEEAPGIVLGICRFHRNANGWNDIGYNFLIDRFGTIYEGRAGGVGAAVVGAHAQGFNSQTFGTASIGTHTVEGVTEAAKSAFAHLLAWKLPLHGTVAAGKTRLISGGGPENQYPAGKLIRAKRVFGHSRVGLTVCPGAALKHQIKEIRQRAQALIDLPSGATTGP
jgi:hypothetical protein